MSNYVEVRDGAITPKNVCSWESLGSFAVSILLVSRVLTAIRHTSKLGKLPRRVGSRTRNS